MKKLYIPILSTLLASFASAQDYKGYDALLKKYATLSGVNYKAWHSTKDDKKHLDSILTSWTKVNTYKLNKTERAAFRINLYNAAMVKVVLDHYPLKSVTKIGKPFSIFDRKIINTPSGKISLNTLEKKQLLKEFPDARVHFAVNCASISCPPLRNEAFTSENLEKQLTDQSIQFSNSKHAVRIFKNTAKYSELFNWYAKDFKTKNPATYLNQFRSKKIKTSLAKSWIKYDWNLNASK